MHVRVNFEIGHKATLRSKRTVDGFTHDWEVFVKGCDTADIQHFVEKVVFYLHETFPNPRRVVKEPPYKVSESGYAGFVLPIDIYLRNSDEPKKITFTYDLNLQMTGPISKIQKEKYEFNNPNEEFRQRLLKGGGQIKSNSSSSNSMRDQSSSDKQQNIKPKPVNLQQDLLKKHRKEHKPEDSFTDLFGTPITKTSKTPDIKVPPKASPTSIPQKPEKSSNPKKSKSKHSPKDKERDKEKHEKNPEKKHKDEKKSKEGRNKEKEGKERSAKRERSPKQLSTSPQNRIESPKRVASPKRPPSSLSQKIKPEEKVKSERKSKHEQKDKDKEKKEHKSHKDKDAIKSSSEVKEHKTVSKDMKPPIQVTVKDKIPKVAEIVKEIEKLEKPPKPVKVEPEKPKHKHKKKDSKEKKERKDEKSKERKFERKTESFFDKILKEDLKDSPKGTQKIVESVPERPKPKEKPKSLPEFLDDSSEASILTNDESSIEVPAKVEQKRTKTKPKSEDSELKKRKRKHETGDREESQPKVEESAPKILREDADYEAKPVDAIQTESIGDISQDYMSTLKELQHKIMTLQDNTELQRVVQLILPTGHYEITAQTFDFDLCALDRDTVRRLQEFFTTVS